MLCCLVGGALVAAVARSVARNPHRRQSLPAALLLGAASGMLVVELVLATLVPLGVVHAPGALMVRLAVIVVLAAAAALGVVAGGGTALLSARGSAFLGLAAGAGALLAEGVDLHLVVLHDPQGAVAGALVHLVPVAVLFAGLVQAGRLAGAEEAAACHCAHPDDRATEGGRPVASGCGCGASIPQDSADRSAPEQTRR